jgi:DNA-binding NarL/FixJ family response regulator
MVTRVLLVDDHELFLEAARAAIEDASGSAAEMRFEVVGSTLNGSEVLPLVARLQPDLVLLDIGLPGIDGISLLDLLRRRHPDLIVVMLTANDQEDHMQAALSRGAAGYILKTIHPADLPAALRQIIDGTVYVAPPAGAGSGGASAHGLTEREVEILEQVARGLPNAAVASELFVTEQTIKFHLTNIYRKLKVENRTAAVRAAHKLGIATNPHLDHHTAS